MSEMSTSGAGDSHDQSSKSSSDVIFAPLGSDEIADNVTCIESLCMSCHEQGETKLLLTKIPFYKDVVVSSFRCDLCHYSNTNIQSCEPIQNRGSCKLLINFGS